MKKRTGRSIGKILGRAMLMMICGMFAASAAPAQSGGGSGLSTNACTINQLRLTFRTGDDDLRGGSDNLNIIVYFTSRSSQVALNVNGGSNWPNYSVNNVYIPLNPPIPATQIRALRLIHVADGSLNWKDLVALPGGPINPLNLALTLQSPDNWNMKSMAATAIINGVQRQIAVHSFHRFTGSQPDLVVYTNSLAHICGSNTPRGNSNGGSGGPGWNLGVNPGGSGLHSVTGGTSSRYGTLTNQDVLRMARAGTPESTIIATIRRSQANFDLSPGALIELKRARVSQNVQDAMRQRVQMGGGKNADDLNPQPYPPKGALLNPGSQQTMLGTQQQGQTLRPLVPRNSNGSAVSGSTLTPLTNRPQSSPMSSVNTASPYTQATMQRTAPPTVAPGQTMSAQTTGPAALMQRPGPISAANVNSQAAVKPVQIKLDPAAYTAQSCAKDPTFRIVAIMENSTGAVSYVPGRFDTNVNLPPTERSSIVTPGHLFTVFGCSFGSGPTTMKGVGGMAAPGHMQASAAAAVAAGGLPTGADVYAMGGNSTSCCYYTWDFVVRSWSDNSIVISAPAKQDTVLTTKMIGVQTAARYNTYAILWK